ncbi:MarR family winged helix-turn-helix transcriptional regulator (plasmid) [Pseudoalteromonas xiamenensis]|uniref:MarR family winged helix-turn-helix transcriptional regulator n=1 Tax=Pseudoalteromonas xiamenensis TaxID=882626 RepID=UPI0027E3BDF5|nr:MarR family winged helix-turn-helix transcriptional regulator [Pseudoalteromonas xiamenensis]WMN62204.1 MarR family winged helix-turn-helix transcriptional regulator [Pseudoalteromonas xiamenensis]
MELKLNEFLPYRLVKLAAKVSDEFAKVYAKEAGLSVAQWRVLAHLAEHPQSTAKQLCDLAAMDKSTVSRAVKQLAEQGMLISEISEKDKRATLLKLTVQGESLYSRLVPLAIEWEKSLLEKLSTKDKHVLFRIIEELGS